ncbi:hypothetical protein [Microcoleus sp. FACHB-672]|uniref:hypothetical protein n=1 Tax=Microcoleus sp. FACHB-672 TaxID=2692825 RepID=UPI00168A20FE|nr:hypothetical protein [Microcoleus sp. FACHB-672]MBD2039182.1 hypothetical protein [Microcoleus sp. FACHB-672]
MSNNTLIFQTFSEIESLIRNFESCTLPRCEWTHHAHLIVALWYLTRYPEQKAINRIRENIQRLNRANGVLTTKDNGYHETITLFWIQIVSRHLLSEGENQTFVNLANSLIHNCGNPSLPLEYYSRDRLMSWKARITWVEPELKSL